MVDIIYILGRSDGCFDLNILLSRFAATLLIPHKDANVKGLSRIVGFDGITRTTFRFVVERSQTGIVIHLPSPLDGKPSPH